MSAKSARGKRVMERISIVISFILGILLIGALIFSCFWLPKVVNSMIDVKDNIGNRNEITDTGRLLVVIDAYAVVAVAMAAAVLMFVLLWVVYKHRVFSKTACGLISAVSWCCFGEALLFMLLFVQFQLVICVALAACMLGFSLRVVKHVIEEATDIKSENDFTI